MRPRKHVVVYCACETQLSVATFKLGVQPDLLPIAARTMEDLRERTLASFLSGYGAMCVLVLRTHNDATEERAAMGAMGQWVPKGVSVIEVCPWGITQSQVEVATVRLKGMAPMEDLLHVVRAAVARKRGPKKRLIHQLVNVETGLEVHCG